MLSLEEYAFTLEESLPILIFCYLVLVSNLQGVVTASALLGAATRDCEPIYGGCKFGLPYFPIFYKKVTQSRRIFPQSLGHRQFSSVVT